MGNVSLIHKLLILQLDININNTNKLMEITKTNQTVNVSATATNGEISYSFNYATQENKLVSLNCQVSKKGIQLGNFNFNEVVDSVNRNFNFNSNAILTDKQSIIADAETIYNDVLLTLTETV